MKSNITKFFVAFLWVALAVACKKTEVEPGQKEAFVKYYGGGLDQLGGNVEQTSDGGYITIGTTSSSGNGGTDMYVVKTDEYGNLQWSKTIGGPGDDEGRCVRKTPDGGYVLLGTYADTSRTKPYDMYLVKLNGSGATQWSRTFGAIAHNDWGYSVQNSEDGGFILIGTTTNVDVTKVGYNGVTALNDLTDVYFLKTDATGVEEWNLIYGFISNDRGTSIQQLNDSVYYTGGFRAGIATDMTIVRGREQAAGYTPNNYINKTGSVSEATIASASDLLLRDGFLYVLGNTTSGTNGVDIYLLKLSLAGSKQWYHTYGGITNDGANGLSGTSDGGFIITGFTQSPSDGSRDIYLVKTNSNGEMDWTQTYGWDGEDVGTSVRQTSDGGYIIGGNVALGGSGSGANNVMCLIKTRSTGKLEE